MTAPTHDLHHQLQADVHQLVDSHQISYEQTWWDHNRNRKSHTVWRWRPSLLDQLVATTQPATTGSSHRRTAPASRPPVNLDATDRLDQIWRGLVHWRHQLNVTGRLTRTPDDTWRLLLRRLGATAPTLAPAIADQLATDVHDWWTWAARQAGWDPAYLLTRR